jgi:NADP-dependent 3-hydroxy acid dehydrogenase YdfG
MLEGKNVVIYGGGGAIGGAVARRFAEHGARLFLAGRNPGALEAIAGQIARAGGTVNTACVDALDERSVREHVDAVVTSAGSIDITFNAVGVDHVQGVHAL